ncbi:LPS export ABC transporter ATP-binding protein [Candidatus Sumerlaeota bacterium]|nr:LPS export ABC transporter ATP-binding protein [Candidatus Sumerlaeota bacterium]
MPTVRTEDLVKIYGGRTVVNRVNIELSDREIVGLLGPNGAGKTTTFNMIVGIIRPAEGTIYLDDVDITQMPMYKRSRLGVGYLAQEPSVFRKLTVGENILAILEFMPLSGKQRRDRCEEILEELGLSHLVDSPAYTLSGGERRRVEIARALVTEPRFMLLDEPFSGVDPKAVEELQLIIRQMKARGLGVLITDHSVRETLTVTDRSYIIHEGTVMISGTAEELVNNPRARELYFGESFYMRLDSDEEPANGNAAEEPVAVPTAADEKKDKS